MADVFNKFKASVNRGVATISVKASSSIEKTKLKAQIETVNGELEKLYRRIGETAYLLHENNAPDFSALNELFETVRAKKAESEKLSEEYNSIDERDSQILSNMKGEENVGCFVCPGCGAKYETKVNFCRSCGTKLPD